MVPTITSTLRRKAAMRTASEFRCSGYAGTISIEALSEWPDALTLRLRAALGAMSVVATSRQRCWGYVLYNSGHSRPTPRGGSGAKTQSGYQQHHRRAAPASRARPWNWGAEPDTVTVWARANAL